MQHLVRYCVPLVVFAFAIAGESQNVPSKNSASPKPAISIEPADPSVPTGGKLRFTIHTTDPADLNVTWSINGDATAGSIDPSGEYTAPITVPDNPPKLTATSRANPTHSASVSIVINAALCGPAQGPCVKLEPLTSMIRVSSSVNLSAHVFNLPDATIAWQVNVDGKRDDSGGAINGGGESVTYTAPAAVPSGKVEINATAKVKGVAKATATAELIVIAPYASVHCVSQQVGSSRGCKVIDFDRLKDGTGTFSGQPVRDDTPAIWVAAVASSKALSTGSVLQVDFPDGVTSANCTNYDWKIVTQTQESPNILIYNPSDIGSGVCSAAKFAVALPVRVLWADVSAFPQQPDPQRTAPTALSTFKDCWGQTAPQTIAPCDRDVGLMKAVYKSNWVYTHFGQAGTGQGTISLSPVIGTGQRQLSFDVQADPGFKAGPGWFNIPLTFEKSTTEGSNLDALIVGLAYDVRALRSPNLTRSSHLILRKPQLQVQAGVEVAPTTPHDKNSIESGTIKIPLVFNFHQQPSAFTAYPVLGIEGGSHFDTHLVENSSIFRGVAGVDGSFRWPFNLTHNFLGTSPITFAYSYRMRWLAYDEPMTDVANNGTETLGSGRRSFFRGSFIVPLTPNIQFQVTALRGSLPPDFRILGNTVVIGLTFTNPGSSEH